MTSAQWLASRLCAAIPAPAHPDVCAWARENVKLPGSARSESFDDSITPWCREPMLQLDNEFARMVTFVAPIQSGKSVFGEVALCYWLTFKSSGDIQYNWQNDEQARDRWDKRIKRILDATKPVAARMPQGDRFAVTKGMVLFPHCNLTVQGVLLARHVASDSIKYQINEEIHDTDGWLPGRLEQAWGRTTAFWDHMILNISNAGLKGSELHRAFEAGTMQEWEVRCPGCGAFHAMRTRWEDKKPELGGLRYDADGCRKGGHDYDYNKLASTIRYQFPCGHIIKDNVAERRELSLSGRYSEPQNQGAHTSHRSYHLEAVAVDYIPWLRLIQEKHSALKAMAFGDAEPWKKYLRERECRFVDDSDRPMFGKLIVSTNIKKGRDGLPGRACRFAAVDYQRGELVKGETSHYWCVIRDVMDNGDSRLVYEGKIEMDSELVDVIDRHAVMPRHVVVDSGDQTTHVYKLCLARGYNAIKGGTEVYYTHEGGARRIFSPEKPLHLMIAGTPPTKPDSPLDEPLFWRYSKAGIRDRLAWLRSSGSVKWEVPDDVSDDYRAHMESEELEKRRDHNGAEVSEWKQIAVRNDLFVCECYIAMLMEMGGFIGERAK